MKLTSSLSLSSLVARARVTGVMLAAFGAVAFTAASAEAQSTACAYPPSSPVVNVAPHRGPVMFPRWRAPRRAPVVVVVAPQRAPVLVPAPVVAPPPSDEHGLLVLGTTSLVAGQRVLIEWGAGFHAGQVIAVNGDGTVRVHYSGWSEMWDESVQRYKLRLPR